MSEALRGKKDVWSDVPKLASAVKAHDEVRSRDARLSYLSAKLRDAQNTRARFLLDGLSPEEEFHKLRSERKSLLAEIRGSLKEGQSDGERPGPEFVPVVLTPDDLAGGRSEAAEWHDFYLEDECTLVHDEIRAESGRDLGQDQVLSDSDANGVFTTSFIRWQGVWFKADVVNPGSNASDYVKNTYLFHYVFPRPRCRVLLQYRFRALTGCSYDIEDVDWANIEFNAVGAELPNGDWEGSRGFTRHLMNITTPPGVYNLEDHKSRVTHVWGSFVVEEGVQSMLYLALVVSIHVVDGRVRLWNGYYFARPQPGPERNRISVTLTPLPA